MIGWSMTGKNSLGMALVAGRERVPNPMAWSPALREIGIHQSNCFHNHLARAFAYCGLWVPAGTRVGGCFRLHVPAQVIDLLPQRLVCPRAVLKGSSV